MSDATVAAMVRRGQRLIRMVSELHRMGYQRLRIMPYEHPLAWRLLIGPVDGFSSANGAYWPGSIENHPIYSSASDTAYFGWTDAHHDHARQLAEKFLVRFPEVCAAGHGRDWQYAGWLSELLGVLETDQALPIVMAEYMTPPPAEMRAVVVRRYAVNAGDRQFVLPPPGLFLERPPPEMPVGTVGNLIEAYATPNGKDLRTFAAVAALVGVAMAVGAKMFLRRDDDADHDLLLPVAVALAGLDPDYIVDPLWCRMGLLGSATIKGLNLPVNFAEPGLLPTVLFGLEHISMAVRDILALTEAQADWEARTWPLLVELQTFSTSVYLGTASILYPGRTLSDFVGRVRSAD